jgi:Fe-S-cluster containining protein
MAVKSIIKFYTIQSIFIILKKHLSMSFQKLSDSIPEFYHRLLPEVFHFEIPSEPFANCADCPLICSDVSEVGKNLAKPFSPETKCCTFSPRIPNYMVGAILSDADTAMDEGRKRIIEKIQSQQGVLPHGLYPTKKYKLLYEASRNDSFGRSKLLMCPYFIAGEKNCTIWKYREAICALWFCKHLAGTSGYSFWNTLIEYMKYVQESLIAYTFSQLGVDYFDPYGTDNTMSYEDLEELPMKNSMYEKKWGQWVGKENEFYIACYNLVNEMSRDSFEAIVGIDQMLLVNKIIEVYQKIVELPELMERSDNIDLQRTVDSYIIEINHYIERIDSTIAYSFGIPDYVLDAFDGKLTTSQVVEKIFKDHSVVLEPEILIALYHHGVLEKK